DASELSALNPGLTNGSANPSTVEVVLVPVEQEQVVLAELSAPAPQAPAGDSQYLVQRGDSLSAIAARHSISVAELRQHNGLRGDTIQVGQTLEIPRRSLAAR
ncbi:LysM peptidoglycan-binding domain-containing protein, partial [Parabacteroides distasonis]